MADDLDLLREFVASGSEPAFRALVERHSAMIHGVATRVAGEGLADEITQAVFIVLAQKAASFREGTIVGGWLHNTARLIALEALRAEKRRRIRNDAYSMTHQNVDPQPSWNELAPALDGALGRLPDSERSVIVLRFLEGLSFSDVAAQLKISEGAAKMRVTRALEKLRINLMREGILTTVAALATTLDTHALSAAPIAVAKSITASVLGAHSGSATGVLVKGGLKAMAMTKTKTALLAILPLFLLCGVVVGIYEVTRPRPVMATFAPMAGEWIGTLELQGDDLPQGPPRDTRLNVQISPDGRTCDIDMRVLPNEVDEQRFHFRHALDNSGRVITTTDDAMIGLLNGPGKVTVAQTNSTGFWQAGFKAAHRTGTSKCEWTVNGSELKIARRDILALGGSKVNRSSLITLHRKQD